MISKGKSKLRARFNAISTVFLAQQFNEIIESPITWRGDGISDVWFFNNVGLIAFTFDGFAKLFSNNAVKLYYWPGQPMIDVRDFTMYNNSEGYMFRFSLGNWTKLKASLMLGLPSLMGPGLSYPINEKDYISAYLVNHSSITPKYPYTSPKDNRSVPFSQRSSVKDTTTANESQNSIYLTWDRDGSLMTSCEIGFPRFNLTFNLYPNVLKFGKLKFGSFINLDSKYPSTVGLTLSWLPIMPSYRFNIR